ncbi:hypothetical protein [Embleya scabrispora]|uniref:hypothetical protein n=1 Tax=Embleya scabrispora TaxID=159449 RepID=UPI00131A3F5A|nr:hypothetical protein [Embleya scabrispora]MYS79380.1 hypothetical protein [Streptomyces sp. SID5474]
MRSVTRKAAITAGLGAALAVGAAGSASATPVTGLVEDLAPSTSTAQSAMPDAATPFAVSQVADALPVGKVLTPGQSPLDSLAANVAEGTARDMQQGMGDMAEQSGPAKGGLGSPVSALPTEQLSTGASSPLGESPLQGLSL